MAHSVESISSVTVSLNHGTATEEDFSSSGRFKSLLGRTDLSPYLNYIEYPLPRTCTCINPTHPHADITCTWLACFQYSVLISCSCQFCMINILLVYIFLRGYVSGGCAPPFGFLLTCYIVFDYCIFSFIFSALQHIAYMFSAL